MTRQMIVFRFEQGDGGYEHAIKSKWDLTMGREVVYDAQACLPDLKSCFFSNLYVIKLRNDNWNETKRDHGTRRNTLSRRLLWCYIRRDSSPLSPRNPLRLFSLIF